MYSNFNYSMGTSVMYFFCFFTALLNLSLVGIMIGWMAPVIIKLQKGEFDAIPTDEEISWLVSLHDIGRALGPIFSAFFLDRIGRKLTSIICSFLFVIAWIVVMFVESISIICLLRIPLGVVQGVAEVTASIYVAENCTPYMRGIIGSMLPLSFFAGVIFEYVVAAFSSYRTLALVNAVISIISLLTTFFLKETPYFLVMRGRIEEAEENLLWLRGGKAFKNEVKLELDKIQQNIQSSKLQKTSIAELFTNKSNVKIMLMIFIVHTFLVMTGCAAINAYVSSLLQSSAVLTSDEYTIIYGIFIFIGACISPFIIEKFNRRTLLLTALLIMGLAQGSTALLYILELNSSKYFPWLIFTTITTYAFTFAVNFPMMFILRSELLPTNVRAMGGSLGIMIDSLIAFGTSWSFMPVAVIYGIQYDFLVYFSSSIVGLIFIFLSMPETRGKSLVDIETTLKST